MKVYEALADNFVAEGVRTAFGLMGNGNMYWWNAIARKPGVKIHETRHEGTALSMAEGWSRVSGEVGVCVVTEGPGVTQLGTALTVAVRAGTPTVVFAGDSPLGDVEGVHYLDQRRFVEATGAGFVGLWTAAQTDDVVREAFYRAKLESRPVVLNAPMDVQMHEYPGDPGEYKPSKSFLPGSLRILPDPDRLAEAARLIAESRRPVIVAGIGAIRSGADEVVARLSERLGALISTTLMSKGWLARAPFQAGVAGLFSTRTAMELFEQADCVIGVGASMNRYTTEGGYLFPEARYIHVDVKPHLIMGNGKAADCYLQGDARLTLEALEQILEREGVSGSGYHTDEVRRKLSEPAVDPREIEIEPGTVDPRRAIEVLDEALPAEIGVFTGAGHSSAWGIMSMNKPRAWHLSSRAFGAIGQCLPTAIGASLALSQPVVAVDGDAGVIMNMIELDTAARLGARVLVVTFNDEAIGSEYHKFLAKGLETDQTEIPSPDLAAVARALGCGGRQVRSLDELSIGVREFLEGKGPMLLDVRVSRKVISVPFRRAQYGEDV